MFESQKRIAQAGSNFCIIRLVEGAVGDYDDLGEQVLPYVFSAISLATSTYVWKSTALDNKLLKPSFSSPTILSELMAIQVSSDAWLVESFSRVCTMIYTGVDMLPIANGRM